MTARLPPDVVAHIDGVCDLFEAAWKEGQRPRVEDYLDGEQEPAREVLLKELMRLDAHYRDRGKAPATIPGGRAAPSRELARVDGYEILGELGRGGMGVVYKARQLRPSRLVALKMVSAGASAGPRELERFLREADAVALLQHPNIVQVYEVGEQEGRPYFALEFVPAGSLDSHLSGAPQPPRAAAHFLERLAHAIGHAHDRGIIHRDLKPANILLSGASSASREPTAQESDDASISVLTKYEPKITDFGLAKLVDRGAGHPTQSGDLLGTPSYMAPEQVAGDTAKICAATDVYGLGAILYELLTGRPPFRGPTAMETMRQVQTIEPVSPSRLQPRCPRDLVTICMKCLSKSPQERYHSAAALAEDLRRYLDDQSILARPIGPVRRAMKWTRRQPMVAALASLLFLAIAVGVGTGSWLWWRAEEGWRRAEDALHKEREAQIAREATLDRYQVALAHREWLANNVESAEALLDACSVEQRKSWEWRYLDRMRRSALWTFTGHQNTVQSLAVHPAGRHVVSASHDSTVRAWDLQTGAGSIVDRLQSLALAVAFSPDGRWMASSGSQHGQIKIWDAKSSDLKHDLAFEDKESVAVWALAFDSAGRYMAAGGPGRLKIWDLDEQKWVYDQRADRGELHQVAFSPDGRLVATASRRVRVWDWSAGKMVHDWPGHGFRTRDLAFHPDGALLASGGRDGLVRVRSLKTGEEEFTLNAHEQGVTSVTFSPDGEELASAGEDGDMSIWNVKERRRKSALHGHSGAVWDLIYTLDGTRLISAGSDFLVRVWDANERQESKLLPFLAADEINILMPDPSGRYLAWADIFGRIGIWDKQLGKELVRIEDPKQRNRNQIGCMAFSPDGRQIAWRRRRETPKLWDLDKAEPVPLVSAMQESVLDLAFSMDGEQLLAACWDGKTMHLRDLLKGQLVSSLPPSTQRITRAAWSPGAKVLATIAGRGPIELWDPATGESRGTLNYESPITRVAFSPDGRFLATGGVGGKVHAWDLVDNRLLMSVTGHTSNVYGVAVSPDGRRIASAASDCTAKLWDTQTGHEVFTLRTQLHEHSPLSFSPDGEDLISVNLDNRMQIWSAKSPRQPSLAE